jgi:DNA primase
VPRAANGARQALDRREQSERAFLALCVALPELGEEKLAAADLDALFSSPETRRAAALLRGHLASPSDILGEDPELIPLVAELRDTANRLDATPATLELEALQLDLHRLDREISAARTSAAGAGMQTLAAERQKVLDAIRHRLQ